VIRRDHGELSPFVAAKHCEDRRHAYTFVGEVAKKIADGGHRLVSAADHDIAVAQAGSRRGTLRLDRRDQDT
jgi:hypothetical protein